MDSSANTGIKLAWHEWLTLAQEQGILLHLPNKEAISAQEQAQAFYFLRNELPSYPTSEIIEAVIGAYDGKSDDYYAQMLWAKRAHILHILPKISQEMLQNAPSLHQMQIMQAMHQSHFEVNQLWIVIQDLLRWQEEQANQSQHQEALIKLSQNAPKPLEEVASAQIDREKSQERWATLAKEAGSQDD